MPLRGSPWGLLRVRFVLEGEGANSNRSPKEANGETRGASVKNTIDKEFSGDSKKAFRTIVYATLSPSEYFATRVNDAIKGWGTKDHLLIRILITRDEIDMPQIKQYYKQLYGKDMIQAVKSDISGDYQKLMIELCDH